MRGTENKGRIMQIPHKLKVGGHTYKVIYPYVFTERFDRLGDIDYSKKTIRIAEKCGNESRTESAIAVTCIHEVLHAIDDLTGHNMFGGDNEKLVEALSEGIYQVLVDNGFLEMEAL